MAERSAPQLHQSVGVSFCLPSSATLPRQSARTPATRGRGPRVGRYFLSIRCRAAGLAVIAVDADSRVASSLGRAVGSVSARGGAVASLLSDARSIALETESVDCVYCVSVLEHVPDFESVISEIRRILRPAGILVLTFDIDMRGNWELGPTSYQRLRNALQASFSPVCPERVVHPLRILTTDNSTYPMYPHRSILEPLITPLGHSLHSAYCKLRGRQLPKGRLLAGTYGACLRKAGFPETDPEVGPAMVR